MALLITYSIGWHCGDNTSFHHSNKNEEQLKAKENHEFRLDKSNICFYVCLWKYECTTKSEKVKVVILCITVLIPYLYFSFQTWSRSIQV